MASSSLIKLAEKLEGEYASAKSANIKRYNQAIGIYDEILADYAPGGTFGKGFEEQLERTKIKDVGSEIQQNISSGLFGVQTTSGAASRWESEVGQPARLQLEDMRLGRYSQARLDKAGVIERREDEYPDMGLIASLYSQASQLTSGGGFSGYSSGSSSGFPGLAGRTPAAAPTYTPTPSGSPQSYTPSTGPIGTIFNADERGASPVVQSVTKGPSAPTYAPTDVRGKLSGTTGSALLPTQSEATTISSRLKALYPQMFEPGWGATSSRLSDSAYKNAKSLTSPTFKF